MELHFWHTAGWHPDTKKHGKVSYHCLFKAEDGEVGVNTSIINRLRIATEDKQEFIKLVTEHLAKALETSEVPAFKD